MPLTIVSTSHEPGKQGAQPSAPSRVCTPVIDLGADYGAGGWDCSDALPDGATVIACPPVPMYDGAALRWGVIEQGTTPVLKVYDNDNGAPGAESATADQSGNTGIKFVVHVE